MPRTERAAPSPTLLRSLPRLREAASRGPVVDLACGRGRHALACQAAGLSGLALDRSPDALALLRRDLAPHPPWLCARADLETGTGIPMATGSCGAVLVFCFLHRPLAGEIERVLAPGGLLVAETFTTAQRALGWGPRRDAFLLRPGELPRLFPGLERLEGEEGPGAGPRPAALASLVARRPGP